jgi:hypothetical protein
VPVQPGPDLGDDPIHGELVSGRPVSLVLPADRDLDTGHPTTPARTRRSSLPWLAPAVWPMRINPPTRVAGTGSFPSLNHRYAVTGVHPRLQQPTLSSSPSPSIACCEANS